MARRKNPYVGVLHSLSGQNTARVQSMRAQAARQQGVASRVRSRAFRDDATIYLEVREERRIPLWVWLIGVVLVVLFGVFVVPDVITTFAS